MAVNAELTELHKLNESLSADLNKVTLVSGAMKRKWLNKAMNSKRSGQSNEAGSYPEAEKTISESLKGTIDTLTGAMAGEVLESQNSRVAEKHHDK